jgi:hypothetical protein
MTRTVRRLFIFLVFPMLFAFIPGPSNQYRALKNNNFRKGEKMTFRLHYGLFNAGEAIFEVSPDLYKVNSRVCYKITVFGRSTGAFDMMMRIRDTWGTYMDTSALLTQRSYRDVEENNYRLKEYINYFPLDGIARVERHHKGEFHEEYKIPTNIQDIVSGFYFLRTLDYSRMKKGDIISVDAFFEKDLYDFKVKYNGTETVKTRFGKINAIELVPILPDNQLFEGGNAISCWISNDENRMPLKVKARMVVGAVEIDLESYAGLKHPVCFRK